MLLLQNNNIEIHKALTTTQMRSEVQHTAISNDTLQEFIRTQATGQKHCSRIHTILITSFANATSNHVRVRCNYVESTRTTDGQFCASQPKLHPQIDRKEKPQIRQHYCL